MNLNVKNEIEGAEIKHPMATGIGCKHVDNISIEKISEKNYHFVLAFDISGSMNNCKDAIDRKNPRGPLIDRLDAAKEAALRYMKQLTDSDMIVDCTLLLFGSKVHEHKNIKNAQQVESILNNLNKFENETRTDLLLKKTNEMFEDHLTRYPDSTSRPCFYTLVLTDGAPTCNDGVIHDNIRNIVAETLVEGTVKMEKDDDRATTFLQIGESQGATEFLQFLDDSRDFTEKYLKSKYPGKKWGEDDSLNIFDACDTGKSCTTWKVKDDKGVMTKVNRDDFWDEFIVNVIWMGFSD